MIYFSGLDSIIESIYLNDNITNKLGTSNIFVNPENVKYIIGKIIIINTCDYPEEKINALLNNNCKIISRVYINNSNVDIHPYILKLNLNIMWNGKVISDYSTLDEILDNDECSFNFNDNTLYFPKINNDKLKTKDDFGNLTSIGWVLQQVGINIKTDTPFVNLDILKTGKIIL